MSATPFPPPTLFPALAGINWMPIAEVGFSGARVWRGTAVDGREWALKLHPPTARLDQITESHRLMRRAVLPFVPTLATTADGRTLAGRWEATTWMPGVADYHAVPTNAKLAAAVDAVGEVHRAWAADVCYGPSPAIRRRWDAILAWEARPIRPPWAGEALRRLPWAIAAVKPALAAWLDRPVRLHPVIGDVWHDHVLFTGERVTGLIDFAAAKFDSPAADLARLLGSLEPDGDWSPHVPASDMELVRLLDRAGVVGSVIGWLNRLDGPPSPRVAARLDGLVRRLPMPQSPMRLKEPRTESAAEAAEGGHGRDRPRTE